MHSHQTSISPSTFGTFFAYTPDIRYRLSLKILPLVKCSWRNGRKSISLRPNGCNLSSSSVNCSNRRKEQLKNMFLLRKTKRGKQLVAKASGGPDFKSGGGGGWDVNTKRVLGNLALAIGLTYLTMTDQLGWLLNAVVSVWLLAVLLPILGFGAFLWFAGRDIVQDQCPNCGNDFQILRSSLKDGVQLCPFCTQPFSVQNDKFVKESDGFSSDRSSRFRQAFNGFSRSYEKEKTPVGTVVDIEAEIKDVDP